MTGGGKNVSGVNLIDMGKAAATPTASESAMSGAGAAHAGGATAEAAAGAGVAAGERAETESTEEAEVRKPLTPSCKTQQLRGVQKFPKLLSPQLNCALVMQKSCWRRTGREALRGP